MDEFTMEIAGWTASVQCSFGSTREYFRQYLTEKTPDIQLVIQQEDMDAEQAFLDEEADREGLKRRVFTPPFLERAAIARKMAAFLLYRDVLYLHGSTVAVDGRAYLFTAPTGTGKSTHTRLWRQLLGDRAIMVNDDRAFLHVGSDCVSAYGSPWSGKHGLDTNMHAPLAGICILCRGQENQIGRITAEDAFDFLLSQSFLPAPDSEQTVEALAHNLCTHVPLWRMACTKDIGAARMAYDAMSQK